MTHLFEQNHGARIVRQASPGAVSFEPRASSCKLQAASRSRSRSKSRCLKLEACSLQLSVTAPFAVFRCAPSATPAPAARPPRSRSAGSQRRRWSG
ncbi:hypothetical protein B0F86_01395 [Pseudomonas syringae]|nr:hypothetical protein B0F86_01395 [Pseudomonas syringae]